MFVHNGKETLKSLREIIRRQEQLLILMNDNELQINEILLIERLFLLTKSKENTTTQLAKDLSLTPSAISNILNKLEKKGYVERKHDELDRRKVYILPIGNSKKVKDKYSRFCKNIRRNLKDDYSSEELSLFDEILKSIETYLN